MAAALSLSAQEIETLSQDGSESRVIRLPAVKAPNALRDVVLPGRLTELSSQMGGATSAAVSLVIHAQEAGEPAVWVQPCGGGLYPPDLDRAGVDLDSLLVVHVPEGKRAAGLARAAEVLLRSGSFGLVICDMSGGAPRRPAWQGRVLGLARKHGSRVVVLTRTPAEQPSLGSLVSARVQVSLERRGLGRYVLESTMLKDKMGLGGRVAPIPVTTMTGLG